MSSAAIRVEKLGKMYRIDVNERKPTSWAHSTLNALGSPFAYLRRMMRPPTEQETLWALRDVSFEVEPGDVLGIIGHNGAGKSTLLKILSRLTDPTEGRAIMRGRVGSLLEVGTGFHQELTGRENIYLSGTILGMTKAEIDRKLDEIVAFAEMERFLDTPVKRYSSGMSVRLGFAVAAHLEPEILIVDEVLAVGDASFQKKCMGKLSNISGQGRTILFVSHIIPSVQALCNRVMLMQGGRIVMSGEPPTVISEYLGALSETTNACVDLTYHPKRITPIENSVFTRICLRDANGKPTTQFLVGDKLTIELVLDVGDQTFENPLISILIERRNVMITSLGTHFMVRDDFRVSRRTKITCTWDTTGLVPGAYSVHRVVFKKYPNGSRVDAIEGVASFDILPRDVFGTGKLGNEEGILIPSGEWKFEHESPSIGSGSV